MGTLGYERRLAYECVGSLGQRWSHVEAVGRVAERLAERTKLVNENVVRAAWLHDVGYGLPARITGFHALDGARYLSSLGIDAAVVSLVAFHTGAAFEAEERELVAELAEFDAPNPADLDTLTMIDLAVGPDGSAMADSARLTEVMKRYKAGDPVARAVGRSRPGLLAASSRAKERLGLPDKWPLCS